MAKPSRIGSAVSFAALATVLGGCAASADKVQTASYQKGKPDGDVGLATRAMAALNANDVPRAIDFAERAVAKTPSDAGFRALLGNAYFAAGRFASAEAAYKDALSIYEAQPKVVLKLALAQIAQGKADQAVASLNQNRAQLDAADYGLALALAGQAADAIPTLEAAAREQGADGRVRQNLALAYAFTGDWAKAKTIAAQDVPASQLDARLQQWMQLAKPARAADQVAALTGVTPAATDPGQPVRLALTKPDTMLAEAAQADAVPTPTQVEAAPAQIAEAGPIAQPETIAPAPPPVDPVRVAAAPEPAAPVTVAAAAAVAPEAPAAFAAMSARFAPVPKPAKARRPAARPAPLRLAGKGPVMQLGAYKSPQYVNAAWSQLTRKYPALRSYLPLRARFDSPKGTFYRLSVQGFATQREALARCDLLKSHGGNCFVRGFAGDAPVEIASR